LAELDIVAGEQSVDPKIIGVADQITLEGSNSFFEPLLLTVRPALGPDIIVTESRRAALSTAGMVSAGFP
jgi:hypothetical protein